MRTSSGTEKSVASDYDLYIFDFDGTIIDSKDLMKAALRHCYSLHDSAKEPPFEQFFSMMGDSLENIFDVLGLPLELTRDYKLFSAEHIHQVKVFRPIVEVLHLLKQRQKKITLFTGKDKVRTLLLLKRFHLDHLFDAILTPDDVTHPKPDPEGIDWLVEKLRAHKDRTLMIGDGLFDVLAANQAGVDSVYVDYGTGNREEIEPLSPTYVYRTPEMFLQAVKAEEDRLKWKGSV